jgi:hypothetical protein
MMLAEANCSAKRHCLMDSFELMDGERRTRIECAKITAAFPIATLVPAGMPR